MPYKFEYTHLKVRREDDKRVKLTEDDKQEIRKLYAQGLMSQRQLAEEFNQGKRNNVLQNFQMCIKYSTIILKSMVQ